MPYITPERRSIYDQQLARLRSTLDADTPGGDINYIITSLVLDWLEKRGLSYAAIAEAVGVFETAKLEFYRRVASPYEDRKIEENGDVFD